MPLDDRKKYFAQLERLLRECDVAIEVVDARDIPGTRIRKLEPAYRDKIIIAATKADLKPPQDGATVSALGGFPLVFFSARTRRGVPELFKIIRRMVSAKRARKERDFLAKIAVFGIPNVGKSSLINLLRGRHVAKTGFKPGVSRGMQWIRLGGGLLLSDTAGVVSLQATKQELALKSAFDVENLHNPEGAALEIILRFIYAKNHSLCAAYSVPFSEDPDSTLESIARKRGRLLKGGVPDIFEAAKIVVREFQKGKFVL